MPKDYGGGPGLKTGSSWSGNMASGPSGGMAQAYGTRNRDGSVSWNGVGGYGDYTGYGDYYNADIPRQMAAAQQGNPVPAAYPVKPVVQRPVVQKPVVAAPEYTPPPTKFYNPLSSVAYTNYTQPAPYPTSFGPRNLSYRPEQFNLGAYANYHAGGQSYFPGFGQMNDAYAGYGGYNNGANSPGQRQPTGFRGADFSRGGGSGGGW